MSNSYRLFRIFGINIKIHATFLLLPLFLGFLYTRDYGWEVGLRAFTLVLLVFVFVLAHELSHSLRAKKYGIRVPEITLYPIGGVASMQRIPREPWQEFTISIVGPLSNFVMALVLYFPLYIILGRENLFSPSLESWPRTFANLFWINPVLGIFNLIPAFPMDGGRILRAILAKRMNYLNATRISVYIGHIFAILFVLLGIWTKHWMLILIALFIYLAASNEEKMVLYEEILRQNNERKEASS